MPLETLDGSPPPFFKQGPSALSRLVLFSALALFLMVADARFKIVQPLRAAIATVLYPAQWLALQPVQLAQTGLGYLTELKTAHVTEDAARLKLAEQSRRLAAVLDDEEAGALPALGQADRFLFGRGLRGRHFAFELRVTGTRAYINDLSVNATPTKRRV